MTQDRKQAELLVISWLASIILVELAIVGNTTLGFTKCLTQKTCKPSASLQT